MRIKAGKALKTQVGEMNGLLAITGGAGFIGKAVVEACLREGYKVRVLSRSNDARLWPEGVELYVGDLVSTTDWSDFVSGVDFLVHLAAEISDLSTMQLINVEGPKRLLEAAVQAGVRRWVQLSSVGAYGATRNGVVTEQTIDNPNGLYETTKTQFDEWLRTMTYGVAMSHCIVRPSIVYGSGMRNQSIRQMARILAKRLFFYIGPRGASANYVHVNDVVSALLLCLKEPSAANQTYIVSAWSSVEEMVEAMAEGLNVLPPRLRIPLPLVQLAALAFGWLPKWPLAVGRVNALTNRSRYSTKKIEQELGWQVTVPVAVGMRAMAEANLDDIESF